MAEDADADVGDGRTFSMRQMVLMLTAATALSGGGAAFTVTASDTIQNNRIETVEDQVTAVQIETKKTTREVVIVQEQVKALEKRVDKADESAEKRTDDLKADIKKDISDLRGLIIRSIENDHR